MKNIAWVIVFLVCSLFAMAQTKYEVTANTFLNVRSYADAEAPVLGTIDRGGVVEVYDMADGWAKIGYEDGYAYVSSKYLKEVEEAPIQQLSTEQNSFFSYRNFSSGDVKWLVFVIACLSLVLFFFRKNRGNVPLDGGMHTANCILFLTVCILELVYVMLQGGNAIWFCSPNKVGWIWTIVNFLIFGFVVYNQFLCFFNTLEDVEFASGSSFDKRWGIYSWGGGIVAGVVSGFFFPSATTFVFVLFAICQIIQIVLIFRNVTPFGGFGNAVLCVVVYLLGSVSTVVILAHFVVLLIIVLIGFLVLSALGHSSNSSKGCCSKCNHYSGGYCSYHNCHIYDADRKTCDNYS